MPPSPNLIALLYLVAAAVGVGAAVAIWRHREMAGARPLAAMLVAPHGRRVTASCRSSTRAASAGSR